MEKEIATNEAIITKLLLEYDDHRDAIKEMIVELEKIKEKIDRLIPETLDARYARFFEEKVKSVTALFISLLEMRKEITKSVKDEIEIRRKIDNDGDSLEDVAELIDIRKMSRKLEDFEKEKERLKQKRHETTKAQIIDKEIDIPGVTSRVEGH